MGVRPLPQLTRLSQGMRPPCQSTLTPSESRLRRQREVSQAAAETEAVQSPRPQPWLSARSARGSLAMVTLQDSGSREQGTAIPRTRSHLSTTPAGARSRAPRTHPRGRLCPRACRSSSVGALGHGCVLRASESGLRSL